MVSLVEPVSTGPVETSASQSVNKQTVDYDAFLTLLVEQLKNQDPTEPMKSTEYMAQLASFSNVEQSVQIKEQLESMTTWNYINQGSSLIGKTVSTPDDSVTGTVEEVKIFNDGIVAKLTSGEEVPVGPGLTISE